MLHYFNALLKKEARPEEEGLTGASLPETKGTVQEVMYQQFR